MALENRATEVSAESACVFSGKLPFGSDAGAGEGMFLPSLLHRMQTKPPSSPELHAFRPVFRDFRRASIRRADQGRRQPVPRWVQEGKRLRLQLESRDARIRTTPPGVFAISVTLLPPQ